MEKLVTKRFTCQFCQHKIVWKGTSEELINIAFSRGVPITHERFGKQCISEDSMTLSQRVRFYRKLRIRR